MGGSTAGAKMNKTAAEGEKLLENFFKGFPTVKRAIDYSKDFLRKNGYVEGLYGRRRHLPEISLPAYTLKSLEKNVVDSTFNPFLDCEDREYKDTAQAVWEKIIEAFVINSNNWQKERCVAESKVWEGNDEVANRTYEKLKKFAMDPKKFRNAQWYSDDDKKALAQKDKESNKRARNRDITYLDKVRSQLHMAFDFTKTNSFENFDVPNDRILIQANTGRRAQAERQCFNARIQGCLSYDSLICTTNGIEQIGDLSNKTITVFDGKEWTNAIVLPSGLKQKCVLTTGTGLQIVCSPDHRFLTINTAGHKQFKKLKDLKAQDRLIYSQNCPTFVSNVNLRDISMIDYKGVHNTHDYSFDDIKDPYIRGQILGRIASDGSYVERNNGENAIYLFVAEHEIGLLDYIKNNLPFNSISVNYCQKKNQKVYIIKIASTTLVKECLFLDIKHDIHSYISSDSNLLRGFISGFFDGDGCSAKSNNNINLVFGTQADFSILTDKMHKALNFFGIRNSVRALKDRTRIDIRRADSRLFCERIGFLNSAKQASGLDKSTVKDNHTWDNEIVTTIKDISITDEYIEMYDVCNTERGYFVVNGLITHNSAATLTKLAMIDITNDKVLNDCKTSLIIPVHDELLVECPAYYADIVEERLPQVMVEAAKKAHIDIPQACDPYNVSRWYVEEVSAVLVSTFVDLTKKGIDKQEALQHLFDEHPELPESAIVDLIEGKTEELIF